MNNKWIKILAVILVIILAVILLWPKDVPGDTSISNLNMGDNNEGEVAQEVESPNKENETSPEGRQDPFRDISWEEREIYRSGLVSSAQYILAELPTASVYHLSISIPEEISDNILGHLSVRYFNNEDQTLDEVYFRTFPNFNGGDISINQLMINSTPAEGVFESNYTSFRVDLDEGLEPGESVIISMDFDLTIPTEMGGNYGLLGFFSDVLVLDTFFPIIPAYDENGWYSQHPQHNGDLSYQDSSFFLAEVNAPADMVLLASGVETDKTVQDGRQTVEYTIGPARDFYLAGSKEFTKLTGQIGETAINSYTFPEHSLHQQYAIDYSLVAFDSFGQHFGEYPYTEFDILSSPMLALGIEYPGITSVILDEFVDGAMMYGMPTSSVLESTVVHEIGHQWFYNAVGNDQQNQPWVDEALTQYVTYLYFLDRYGRQGGDSYLDSFTSRWSRVDFAEIPIGMPAGEYRGAEYSAIVYGRGPLFFYELEKEMGLEELLSAIRNYYQGNLWENGDSTDIRFYLEDQCNCDLQEIFGEWIYE